MYMYGNDSTMIGKINSSTYLNLSFEDSTLDVIDNAGESIGSGEWAWNDSDNAKAPDFTGTYDINGNQFRISAWYHEGTDDEGNPESYYSCSTELARPKRGQLPRNPNRS